MERQQQIQYGETQNIVNTADTMTSIEIAEVAGKQHSHVMEAIRKMEPAWEKVSQSKFRLASYKDAQGKNRPCYELTKRECLFIATKFNDEARAKLVLRWEQLETERQQTKQLSAVEMFYLQAQINLQNEQRISIVEQRIDKMEREREENGKLLLEVKLSDNVVPEMSLRDKIRQLVNRYTAATNIDQRDVWHKIYDELYYKYKISIRSYKKYGRQTNLDVAEEHNILQPMYDIISNMVRSVNQ